MKLERETFNLCEQDGEPGLTWDEVEQCEVSNLMLCPFKMYLNVARLAGNVELEFF